jgi:hypothetical protein
MGEWYLVIDLAEMGRRGAAVLRCCARTQGLAVLGVTGDAKNEWKEPERPRGWPLRFL